MNVFKRDNDLIESHFCGASFEIFSNGQCNCKNKAKGHWCNERNNLYELWIYFHTGHTIMSANFFFASSLISKTMGSTCLLWAPIFIERVQRFFTKSTKWLRYARWFIINWWNVYQKIKPSWSSKFQVYWVCKLWEYMGRHHHKKHSFLC